MNIGRLTLENQTCLAPMAGITNLPFRLIARQAGCALVWSEMISANGLVRRSKKTIQMLASTPAEKPLAIQIFGVEPDVMAEAAALAASAGADIVDINFGCSVKKVVKTGAGVALMRETADAEALIRAVRRAINISLTIKIRSGWEKSGRQAIEIAQMAQGLGVDAIAIHPRTATQGFSGQADWPLIATVKKALSIPVIGNGDIFCADDALRMLAETGCDFVMIGRAAVGNPWIFNQVNARLKGEAEPAVDFPLRFQTMRHYLKATVKNFGEKHACLMMRSRLPWFVKGLPYSSRFREAIKQISDESQAMALISEYEDLLRSQDERIFSRFKLHKKQVINI